MIVCFCKMDCTTHDFPTLQLNSHNIKEFSSYHLIQKDFFTQTLDNKAKG